MSGLLSLLLPPAIVGHPDIEMAPRRLLCAAKPPASRTGGTRGGGTQAARFSHRSNGDSWMPRVPSDPTRVKR